MTLPPKPSDPTPATPPPKHRRKRPDVSKVVLETLRKQSGRLDRLGALVEDAVERSMNAAIEKAEGEDADVSLVTQLADAIGRFAKDAGAGVGAMANALDKVSKASPPDTGDNDKPASGEDILSALTGGRKRGGK